MIEETIEHMVLYQHNIPACLQRQISFGFGPDSGLNFWVLTDFEPDLVDPLTTLHFSLESTKRNLYL